MAKRFQRPVAVSYPDGSSTTIDPPKRSRVPNGVMMQPPRTRRPMPGPGTRSGGGAADRMRNRPRRIQPNQNPTSGGVPAGSGAILTKTAPGTTPPPAQSGPTPATAPTTPQEQTPWRFGGGAGPEAPGGRAPMPDTPVGGQPGGVPTVPPPVSGGPVPPPPTSGTQPPPIVEAGPMVQPPPLPIPVAGNQPVIVDQTQPPAEGEPVTSAITGEETPYRVDPGMSDRLQGLLEQLNGMVGGGELGGAMRERALENLENPSAYDDPLFQRGLEQAQRQIDDYYGGLQNRLEQDLGSRGIAYNSSIANTDFNRLASEQGRAFQDVMTNLLQDRARTLAQDRAQAFREASGVRGQDWGEGTDLAGNLFGIESSLRGEERGERAYVDSLRRQGRSDAIEEAMLGESLRRQREADLQGALAALAQQGSPDQAARLLAALGGQYGDIANTTQAGLADLASQFTQRY